MPGFSTNSSAVPRSAIRGFRSKAANFLEEQRAKDPEFRLYDFSVGQPDFASPDAAKVGVNQALVEDQTTYINSTGVPPLVSALADLYAVDTSSVMVSHGCGFALYTTFKALLNPGDEVLLPDPGFVNYSLAVQLLYAKPKEYPLKVENNFVPTLEDITAQITSKTKIILINSPGNPCGNVVPLETLQKLVDLCRQKDIFLLSDEVYADIVFKQFPLTLKESKDESNVENTLPPTAPSLFHTDIDLKKETNFIITSSVSKRFSMTGYRVGWLIAHEDLINLSEKFQEPMISCGVPFSQIGALSAIQSLQATIADGKALDPEENYSEKMRLAYMGRRDIAVEILKEFGLLEYTPEGGFYVFVNCGMDCQVFCERLLYEKNVVCIPGVGFGKRGGTYLRVSFATDEATVREGMRRICELVVQMKKEQPVPVKNQKIRNLVKRI